MRVVFVALWLGTAGASCVTAQSATVYRRTPGDTLRYREVSTGDATLTTEDGIAPFVTRHAATIALRFITEDSVEAWYDELLVEASDPTGPHYPDASSVMAQSFVLHFDARGRVQTVTTPVFPPEFQAVTDLRRQFQDFFMRLPPGPPLTVGREWDDVVVHADTNDHDLYFESTSRIHFRVEGDTVVAGKPALVIFARQQLHLVTGGPIEGEPMRSESVLDGEDTGIFVFDPVEGVMLGRRREAELTGVVRFSGSGDPIEATQRVRYTNVIEALQ